MISEKEMLRSLIRFLETNQIIKDRYQAEIDKFKQQLEQAKLDRYRLGVVGVTSSGKSTMINAIMKKELLSMAVQPSSSRLVSCSKSVHDQVTVYFEDKPPEVKTGRTLSEIIKKYSDERFNPNNSLGVKQLELSTPGFSFPEEVLLIDSPGLDAYGYEGHEKLTMNSLLPTIDFCIYVTTTKTNSDEKMRSILNIIADYDCPLIIVQNMIDAVKPSPDRKKSAEQVIIEHKNRLRRIINESRIKNKNSVSIVQISAKWALDSVKGKLLTKSEKESYYKKSNFNELITTVDRIFNEIRPKIEHRRLAEIKKQVQAIINNAKSDLNSNENERKALRFEYEGYDTKINSVFSSTQRELENVINGIMQKKDQYSNTEKHFSEEILKSIISYTNNMQQKIIDITTAFRRNIEFYCGEFHIDSRRLRVLDSFGAAPGLQIYNKTVTKSVKKSGFGNGVKRFFGKIFRNDDWGYENVTETVYDHKKTRAAVVRYFDTNIGIYSDSCAKWESSAEKQVETLLGQYQNSYDAYIKRKQVILDIEKTKTVVSGLEKLITEIPTTVNDASPSFHETKAPVIQQELINIRIDGASYAIYRLAEKLREKYNQSVYKSIIGQEASSSPIVIGWDSISTAVFINRCFGKKLSSVSKGFTAVDKIRIFMKPVPKDLDVLKSSAGKYQREFFIVFNASQFGSGLSDLNRSGAVNMILPTDNVFFVIQDFDELITGGGISEGIKNLLSIKEKMGLKAEYKIIINHSNPIYEITAGELQRKPCETHSDEIKLFGELQSHFPQLCGPETEKILKEIISGFGKR